MADVRFVTGVHVSAFDCRRYRVWNGKFHLGTDERSISQKADSNILRLSGYSSGRCCGQPV